MRTQREKVLLALSGSVLLHVAVLFAWALLAQIIPGAGAVAVPPPTPEPEPLKVEVVEEEPTPTPAPTPEPKMKPFIDTAELADATPPLGRARFESDKNTTAASEEPPEGDRPLPGQRGKKLPQFAFATRALVPGEEPASAPETAPPPPAPAQTKTAPPATPPPAATPEPPPATDRLAMLAPPAVSEPNPYDPAFRPPSNLTAPPPPTPDRAAAKRTVAGTFQARQEKTGLSGGASRPGAASVDSESTPAGRYKAAVINALKLRWSNYVLLRSDVIAYGMVKIRLIVNREGRVLAPRVISNTANEALASVSLDAVMNARIPAMPADAAAQLDGEQLPIDLELTLE